MRKIWTLWIVPDRMYEPKFIEYCAEMGTLVTTAHLLESRHCDQLRGILVKDFEVHPAKHRINLSNHTLDIIHAHIKRSRRILYGEWI